MTWYMKGQSDYDSADFHMGLCFDFGGFASGDYNTIVMPTSVDKQDPFLLIACESKPTWSPGSKTIEIGLWDDYRIKINDSGIYGWDESGSQWVDLLIGGTGVESHVLATSGPHTGTLPWTDLNKTGSNLTDLATRQHVGLTNVTANQHHTPTVAGDLLHNSLNGLTAGTDYEHITQAQNDALQYCFGLPFTTATGGGTTEVFNTQSVGGLPAADDSCQLQYQGYMPTGWADMVNPKMIILFATAVGTDSWQIRVRVDASKEGESSNTTNLHGAILTFTTTSTEVWHKKEVQLTGTISAGDIVGVRLMKTSTDAQVCYVGLMLWVKRT